MALGECKAQSRSHIHTLKAALVATAETPGFKLSLFAETRRALRLTAKFLGAKPVANLWIGLSDLEINQPLSPRVLERARRIGMKLV